ncbi:MAG TPA: glutamate--tRNA ligase family protein, partial [Clostridia bacterium]|nr:glutamate--tRNA ligase family protein [Clostridia bacterium]
HVLRGDEWLSSAPIHLQLFEVLGQKPPVYGHIAPILKKEGDSKRKFSKRRDADGHIAYYEAQGIPPRALLEYDMHLINASYEDWRRGHPDLPLEAYVIDLNQLSVSGAVFDLAKLHHIAKNEIAGMSASGVLQALLDWSAAFDPALHAVLSKDPDYALAVLSIDRGTPKPRKDLAQWSDARRLLGYFWDECFDPSAIAFPANGPDRAFLQAYVASYDPEESKDAWFARLKETAQAFGYAPDRAAAHKESGRYTGTIADAAAQLRLALTGLD